ncbi:glucose-1-phosphate adenylyltransferase [uncultured Clostridium sp.]|uniref:glucose-1-phosphate adenylyltransferase n=1 Tax=uncultured Clostridium sp. TaxID=59620 RepID=UPI00262ABB87|nr:glucose-1-phosphate adenylyltransferase [uncultured Clostridium sp.]
MRDNKEMVAMILAGGQGTRLGVLTERLAKPAVPYGGKYRLIDFPLSNCVNSGINTVGVVTQYKPKAIYSHIGEGEAWDLDKITEAGVSFLPPYTEEDKDNCYRGTADAIYQNIEYIDSYNPEYVLILSGDHIYKMNYDKMLQQHKETKADATISVINVSMEEASRFGIMNLKNDNSIDSFEEKPKVPKSTTASMGVYIFTWSVLKEYLISDNKNDLSENDFGKNVIPQMLADDRKMYGYRFKGYWRDVGTVESLWEANMDILNPNCELNLFDSKWQITSTNMTTYDKCQIELTASVKNSILGDGCKIQGTVKNSVLSPGVVIGEGAVVKNSVILGHTIVEPYALIQNAIIGGRSIIREGVVIASKKNIVTVGRKREVSRVNHVETLANF